MSLILSKINQQVDLHGSRLAIGDASGRQLSYTQLDEAVGALASRLLRDFGAQPGGVCAVFLDRSVDYVIAMLGAFRAGYGFVPVDASLAEARVKQILAASGARVAITSPELRPKLPPELPWLGLDAPGHQALASVPAAKSAACDPEQLAYVIFTSGSTGEPKAVGVPHRALAAYIDAMAAYPGYGSQNRFVACASFGFDMAIFEVLVPLALGASVTIAAAGDRTDGSRLRRLLEDWQINTMMATPSTWRLLLAAGWQGASDFHAISAGEALSSSLASRLLPLVGSLWNMYGPTETTVVTLVDPITDPQQVTLGEATKGTSLHIRSHSGVIHPHHSGDPQQGLEGELLIGGPQLSLGYLNDPHGTAKAFVTLHDSGQRLYCTGDLVRVRGDGRLDYLGRGDQQVKVRGHRIELGEIEGRLAAHPAVSHCLAVAGDRGQGETQVVAYLQLEEEATKPSMMDLRRWVEESLPAYMVPAHLMTLKRLPLTSNGKVDNKALPTPHSLRSELGIPLEEAASDLERDLAAAFARELQFDKVGVTDQLFDLGLSSMGVSRVCAQLAQKGLSLAAGTVFDQPTVRSMAASLGQTEPAPGAQAAGIDPVEPGEPIAIIGMAAQFPGAPDLQSFWQQLCEGRDAITRFAAHELDPSVPQALRRDPNYVPARGVLTDAGCFDHEFFAMSPVEAELSDPQHRLFLQSCYHALEDSGYPPSRESQVGVFAGCHRSAYFHELLRHHPEKLQRAGDFPTMIASEKDYIATRVSYKLQLTGPAMNINTACSTSLVAVIQACQSLRLGQCKIALAGGATVAVPQHVGHLYQEGSIQSKDGRCRPFDAEATGTLFSDGVGVVVLKPLSSALRDGDRVYAAIHGTGLNNDGGRKASFAAPSSSGQAACITQAWDEAGVNRVDYVEAHGTGTPLGDPIEAEALLKARRSLGISEPTAIGSLKGNFGHTVAASGVAGLIKTALAMHKAWLPPSIHFSRGNHRCGFDQQFFVQREGRRWAPHEVAGVSSFGVGGTNAHVLLKGVTQVEEQTSPKPGVQLLLYSGHNEAAAAAQKAQLQGLGDCEPEAVAGIASTLQRGRDHHRWRDFQVVDSASLQAELCKSQAAPREVQGASQQCWVFPGQGSQYPGMGLAMYRSHPVFRRALQDCHNYLATVHQMDLLGSLEGPKPGGSQPTSLVQLGLYGVQWSLAQVWLAHGLQPRILVGHSVGEFTCGALAGVFSWQDGLDLVLHRGRAMDACPVGAMTAVRCEGSTLEPYLMGSVVLAADNGPRSLVMAGPESQVASVEQSLSKAGIAWRRLAARHGFHSPAMEPAVAAFESAFQRLTLQPPKLPMVSTVSGQLLGNQDAQSSHYWTKQLRLPVKFKQAIATVLAQTGQPPDFLEVGPGAILSKLIKQIGSQRGLSLGVYSSLPAYERGLDEYRGFLTSAGRLWQRGYPLNWQPMGRAASKEWLPGYPFAKHRHWFSKPDGGTFQTKSKPAPHADSQQRHQQIEGSTTVTMNTMRQRLQDFLQQQTGIDVGAFEAGTSFLEMGLDSLVLTQMALALQEEFGLKLSFRELMDDYDCLENLAEALGENNPEPEAELTAGASQSHETSPQALVSGQEMVTKAAPESTAGTPAPARPALGSEPCPPTGVQPLASAASLSSVQHIVQQQLELMQQQLRLLGVQPQPLVEEPAASSAADANSRSPEPLKDSGSGERASAEGRAQAGGKAFGAMARISRGSSAMTPRQQEFLASFTARYTEKTAASKAHTQTYRGTHADPRAVTGFKAHLKELVYPIVMKRSSGARMWDLDGREYVDITSGFGSNFFGNSPSWLKERLRQQVDQGFEIGPQHHLAGGLSERLCRYLDHDRVAFCNTGSEAVLGAMRIARTVTGRREIVSFNGSYHGINDEVIVRGVGGKAFPAAPGIMASAMDHLTVLDYGTDEALAVIKAKASKLAAILVEPVQSRRPEFRPQEFLEQLRRICDEAGCVLIFDEVITGFRYGRYGAQGYYGIKADLASYGKVIGGGLAVGVLAGKRAFMDALDGGHWQFGDHSVPEVGVTYFAGTFVRHPLALAAMDGVMDVLEAGGDSLQSELNRKADGFVREINEMFARHRAPFHYHNFGSLMRLTNTEEQAPSELLCLLLRERGVHTCDGFPNFLTLAHQDEDLALVKAAFAAALGELASHGFFGEEAREPSKGSALAEPVPGEGAVATYLGRGLTGQLQSFEEDPQCPGVYRPVGQHRDTAGHGEG